MARVRLAAGRRGRTTAARPGTTSSASWADAGLGTLSPEHELVPEVGLTVGFAPGDGRRPVLARRSPAAISAPRTRRSGSQLVDADHFTWGFDNGAPLYRAQVAEPTASTVTLLTEPRDPAHWPLAGQIVEILPWGAVLANGEKLAEEIAPGHLVAGRRLLRPRHRRADPRDRAPGRLRRRLGEPRRRRRPGREPLRAAGAGRPVLLPPRLGPRRRRRLRPGDRAGAGAGRARHHRPDGDHRRPRPPPGRLLDHRRPAPRPRTGWSPWQLEVGRAPHGFRRFVAPLAVITWAADGTVTVRDCRPGFRPLTEIESCCTVTVGDGSDEPRRLHQHPGRDRQPAAGRRQGLRPAAGATRRRC